MKHIVWTLIIIFSLISCGSNEPKAIKLNYDTCDFCKMTIANAQFATQAITQKGRYYKFDDIACMVQYTKLNNQVSYTFYCADYSNPSSFIEVQKAFFIQSELLHSPMRGNIAAFSSKENAAPFIQKFSAQIITWENINSDYK